RRDRIRASRWWGCGQRDEAAKIAALPGVGGITGNWRGLGSRSSAGGLAGLAGGLGGAGRDGAAGDRVQRQPGWGSARAGQLPAGRADRRVGAAVLSGGGARLAVRA